MTPRAFKLWLRRTGLTPRQVALELGLHVSTVYAWRDGARNMSALAIWACGRLEREIKNARKETTT